MSQKKKETHVKTSSMKSQSGSIKVMQSCKNVFFSASCLLCYENDGIQNASPVISVGTHLKTSITLKEVKSSD